MNFYFYLNDFSPFREKKQFRQFAYGKGFHASRNSSGLFKKWEQMTFKLATFFKMNINTNIIVSFSFKFLQVAGFISNSTNNKHK